MADNRILSDIDDVELVDESAFTYKNGGSKSWKSIVLNHYDNCIKEGAKEMNAGGIQRRIVNGEIVEVMVPNQVEIFINHVEMLKRSLIAEIQLNEDIIKKMKFFENIRKKYISQYQTKRKQILKTYNKLSSMPNPDGFSQRDIYRDKYVRTKEQIDKIYNEKMLELYQEQLFPFLTQLIAKRNYFEEL